MKKLLLLFCLVIFASQIFTGCTAKESQNGVLFKEFYSEILGFSQTDEKAKPVPLDAVLMMTNEDFNKFKDKYFTVRELPMQSPDKDKAVLYLQIPSPTSSVNEYKISSINASGKTLTVNLKKSGVAEVDSALGVDAKWKWVVFLEVDKTSLTDDMKIVVKR